MTSTMISMATGGEMAYLPWLYLDAKKRSI
jgi:hypothetical protein